MIKKQRRKKSILKRILIIILILAAVVGLLWLIAFKVFTVENVEVEGNELYPDDTISETVLNDEYSWNTLYVFFKYKFMKPEAVPFIDSMEVSMGIPHTIKIKVYEKGMLGYVYIDSIAQNAYFDKDGIVVETSQRVIEDVPKITGLDVSEVVLYEKLPVDSETLRSLLSLTQTLEKNKLKPDEVNVSDGNYTIQYGKIKVMFGSIANLPDKVLRLSEIIPKLDGESGVLHLEQWSEETTDIVFERE